MKPLSWTTGLVNSEDDLTVLSFATGKPVFLSCSSPCDYLGVQSIITSSLSWLYPSIDLFSGRKCPSTSGSCIYWSKNKMSPCHLNGKNFKHCIINKYHLFIQFYKKIYTSIIEQFSRWKRLLRLLRSFNFNN